MKTSSVLPLLMQTALLTSSAAASSMFFAGTYGGGIVSVDFDETTGAMTEVTSNTDSAPAPSWQEVTKDGKFLYSIEETTAADESKGGLTSYSIGDDGELTKVASASGLVAPVSLGIHPEGKVIVTANYGGAGISVYNSDATDGSVTFVRDITFELDGPGTVPDRQEASHPHQALWDPSGKFVTVPDLGADLVRLFAYDSANSDIVEMESISVPAGTGPRHGLFYPAEGQAQFYYVVGELSNTVTSYKLDFSGNTAEFTEIQVISTLPEDYDGETAAAGEIILAPNGKHIYVSNRLDTIFEGTSSMVLYGIDTTSGQLENLDIFNGYTENIRHMTVHPDGKWLVTAGQDSSSIASIELDPETGKAGEKVGDLVLDKPVCLQWA